MFKKLFLAATVATLMLASSHPAAAGQQDFTIHNKTGLKFVKLYVEPESNTSGWGDEVLKGTTIDNGEQYDVKLDGYGTDCKWGVWITDSNGEEYFVREIDICKINDLKFEKDGSKVIWSAN